MDSIEETVFKLKYLLVDEVVCLQPETRREQVEEVAHVLGVCHRIVLHLLEEVKELVLLLRSEFDGTHAELDYF